MNTSWTQRLILAAAFIGTFATSSAQAYFSTIDTGELISSGKYQVVVEPQLIFNDYDGVNFVGRFDTGLTEESAIRGILGFGEVDFQIGGLYKWIPFPDVDNQPAIGLEAGVILARVSDMTEFSFRLHPLASKRFETEVGDLIPYAALPFGFTTLKDDTIVPIQLQFGTEMRPLQWPNVSFYAELGIELHESFSYLSLGLAYRFDDDSFRRNN